MMNLNIPSKICLSLRELKSLELNKFKKITNLLELRLDYLYLSDSNFNLLIDSFEFIILKSNYLSDYDKYLLNNCNDKYSNIIFDIDYKFIEINDIKSKYDDFINHNIIISFHNIRIADLDKIFGQIIYYKNRYNPILFKIVISDSVLNDDLEFLEKQYKILSNIGINNIILFIEGEKYTETRYLSLSFGAPYTYCAVDENNRTGSGQPTIEDFFKYFQKKTI